MLVIERKRGPACAAGSGGMEQPDPPSKGGVRLPRLRRGSRSEVLPELTLVCRAKEKPAWRDPVPLPGVRVPM